MKYENKHPMFWSKQRWWITLAVSSIVRFQSMDWMLTILHLIISIKILIKNLIVTHVVHFSMYLHVKWCIIHTTIHQYLVWIIHDFCIYLVTLTKAWLNLFIIHRYISLTLCSLAVESSFSHSTDTYLLEEICKYCFYFISR